LFGRSLPATLQHITLSFDVSTVDPNTFINLIGVHSYPEYGGFMSLFFNQIPDGQYQITTSVKHLGTSYGSASFSEVPGQIFVPQSSSANLLANADTLSVTTSVWLYNGETIRSFVLGFNLVPEPGSFLLVCVGLIGAGFKRLPRI
jgi:hypothetical protein